jgi:hypothetical protein
MKFFEMEDVYFLTRFPFRGRVVPVDPQFPGGAHLADFA